jgi:hypothetical protein
MADRLAHAELTAVSAENLFGLRDLRHQTNRIHLRISGDIMSDFRRHING